MSVTAQYVFDPLRIDYSRAACKGTDVEAFMDYQQHSTARKVCLDCPLISDCFFEAARDNLYGTWGAGWFGKVGETQRVRSGYAERILRFHRTVLAARMGITARELVDKYGSGAEGIGRALRAIRP